MLHMPGQQTDEHLPTVSVAILAQALKVHCLFSVFFTLPSCSLMATDIDEAAIVQAIRHGLASGWGNSTGSCCCCKRNPTNPSRRPTW